MKQIREKSYSFYGAGKNGQYKRAKEFAITRETTFRPEKTGDKFFKINHSGQKSQKNVKNGKSRFNVTTKTRFYRKNSEIRSNTQTGRKLSQNSKSKIANSFNKNSSLNRQTRKKFSQTLHHT